jgi:hypothetical protein
MAFKIVKQLEIDWPVPVNVPTSGGKTELHTFTAKFKIMGNEYFEKAQQKAKDDIDLISKLITGWDGVLDDNDKPVKYSKKALSELCSLPFVRIAIIKAYTEALNGAEAKN